MGIVVVIWLLARMELESISMTRLREAIKGVVIAVVDGMMLMLLWSRGLRYLIFSLGLPQNTSVSVWLPLAHPTIATTFITVHFCQCCEFLTKIRVLIIICQKITVLSVIIRIISSRVYLFPYYFLPPPEAVARRIHMKSTTERRDNIVAGWTALLSLTSYIVLALCIARRL